MRTFPAPRGFSLSSSERQVKRFCLSGLLMRRIEGCRRPAWKRADRILIALRARRCLEGPPVFRIPSRQLFALALSSVFPMSPASPASALVSGAQAEPRPQVGRCGTARIKDFWLGLRSRSSRPFGRSGCGLAFPCIPEDRVSAFGSDHQR